MSDEILGVPIAEAEAYAKEQNVRISEIACSPIGNLVNEHGMRYGFVISRTHGDDPPDMIHIARARTDGEESDVIHFNPLTVEEAKHLRDLLNEMFPGEFYG